MKQLPIYILAFLFFQIFMPTLSAQKHQDLFFVFLNSNPNREKLADAEAEKLQAAHIANIDSLYETGDLVAAGPFNDGGGIFALVAKDSAKAEQLLNTDPMIRKNSFNLEYFPFRISAGGVCAYNKPAVMKTYAFVRWELKEGETIDPVKYSRLLNKQQDFFTETHLRDSVLIAGNFTNLNQGIMVISLSEEAETKLFVETSPLHNSGLFDYKIRKLWIAEGTFCRKE